ncbi:MAG TPA: hypothetical protein VHZ07_24980 [Bryobacteraceae bacterium]|nr:hypothetical protein [Bryobacteraceae bacterium]
MNRFLVTSLTVAVLAIVISVQARAQTSDEFSKQMEEGQRAMSLFDYPTAILKFEAAIRLDDRSASAHEWLANALMGSVGGIAPHDPQTLERAKEEEQIALGIAPNEAEALAGLAAVTYESGLASNNIFDLKMPAGTLMAMEILQKAVAADPKNYHANLEIAHIENRALGVALLRAAISSNQGQRKPLSPEVRQKLRGDYGGMFEDAIRHAAWAVEVQPNAFSAMHELSGLFRLRSSIEEGEDVKADQRRADNWADKSQSAFARAQRKAAHPRRVAANFGSYEEAMAAGRKALAAFDYEDAIAAFKSAAISREDSADAHVELANVLILSGDGDAASYPYDSERVEFAEKEDQRALQIRPHNAEALAGLADATYSKTAHTIGADRAAIAAAAKDWAQKALAADPNNFHANYMTAHMAYQEYGVANFDAVSEAYKKGFHEPTLPPGYLEPLRKTYGDLVDEGLRCALNALKTKPDSYLAMYELSNLYRARYDLSRDPSPGDLELSNKWRMKSVQFAPKDDPRSRIVNDGIAAGVMAGVLGSIPSVAPPPPPPPRPTPN